MASPPRLSPATSPPYPQHIPLPNPRKRPSLHLHAGYNPSKRRKQGSIASGASSAHPLRQTSFPPEEGANDFALRSPSVESDITGLTGHTGKGKSGRRKGIKSAFGNGGSVAERSGGLGDGEGEEEEEEEEDGEDLIGEGEKLDKAAEQKNLAVLVDAFDDEQAERYELFRRVKLRKETVRKIANFTLAQSVPPAVITVINGYTKTFMGTLIERAREVQQQWAALETPPQTPERNQKMVVDPADFGPENPDNDIFAQEGSSKAIDANAILGNHASRSVKEKQRYLGPLLPDHLREALRRHRRDGEGMATGLTGFSVGLGIAGTGSARLQGKRLFR